MLSRLRRRRHRSGRRHAVFRPRKLFALSESYPDLKANQNFLQLQEELTSTENKIGFS